MAQFTQCHSKLYKSIGGLGNVWNLIKRYWDIFGGVITGLALTIIAQFKLEKVQLYYSIIILLLVSIGCLRIIKQTIEKQREKKPKKRKHNIIDDMVDTQKPVKAISLAAHPTREGEKLGKLIIDTLKGVKRVMKKLKEWFDKFKGYILTIALGILTIIEMCGGYINDLLGDALTIRGVEVLPIITLGCAIIVGLISNGFTKEQREKIKALFAPSTTNELVITEIKKTIKDDEAKLKLWNKDLAYKENELATLETQLTNAQNTHAAKKEMLTMVPQLATADDVQLAANDVVNIQARIVEKKAEIEKTKTTISNLITEINALKTQL